MSEPSSYACDNCEGSYRMGEETIIFIYLRQPWFNHIDTTCPRCRTLWTVYELSEDTINYIIENNMEEGDVVRRSIKDFADEEVWREYCKNTGREFPAERFIATREQAHIDAECGYFAYLLERGDQVA